MILSTLFARNSLENPSVSLADGDSVWGGLGFDRSSAGIPVNRDAALKLPAVWRAVDLISDSVGKLPLNVFKRKEGGKELAVTHPAYQILRYQPNPDSVAFKFRKVMEMHRLLCGNAYAYVRRRGDGTPLDLSILNPDDTFPMKVNGALWYSYRNALGNYQALQSADVIHITGLGYDGYCGYPITHKARDSFGLGLATNEYAARFFRNNAEPRVIITTPGPMPPEAQKQFLKQWEQIHQGTENSHKTAIVTMGGKVEKVSIDAQDAQLIEQRKFTIIDIANWFGLPPHKLGDSSRTAYNSLEQENQSFLDECLDARLVSWEEELRSKLLTEREKREDSHLVVFDRKALVRADLPSKSAYYQKALAGAPWMTIDEVRIDEDMNPVEGDIGNEIIMPASLTGPPAAAEPVPVSGEQQTDGTKTSSDAGLQTDLTLNGAQVDAARQILLDLASGLLAPEAAVELLVGVGIPRDRAQAMVNAQMKVQKTQEDQKQQEAAAAPAEKPQPDNNLPRAVLLRSCVKMAERIAKNCKRKAKQPDVTAWIYSLSDDHRKVLVEEFVAPLLASGLSATPEQLADKILTMASDELKDLRASVSAPEALEGAVTEWSKRFTGAAMERIVGDLFGQTEPLS